MNQSFVNPVYHHSTTSKGVEYELYTPNNINNNSCFVFFTGVGIRRKTPD